MTRRFRPAPDPALLRPSQPLAAGTYVMRADALSYGRVHCSFVPATRGDAMDIPGGW